MLLTSSIYHHSGVIAGIELRRPEFESPLYGAEAWGMRSAVRRKVNVLEMKCLRRLVGVSRMDRVRNEEVRR